MKIETPEEMAERLHPWPLNDEAPERIAATEAIRARDEQIAAALEAEADNTANIVAESTLRRIATWLRGAP